MIPKYRVTFNSKYATTIIVTLVLLITGLLLITVGFTGNPVLADVAGWSAYAINATSTSPSAVQAADIDGDLDMDIVVAERSTMLWYENDSTVNFTSRIIDTGFSGNADLYVTDINNDGNLDVLGADDIDNDVYWYENDGSPSDGGWTKHVIKDDFDDAFKVFAVDLDNDNDMDVLGVNRDGDTIAWFENDGSEVFTYRAIDTSFAGALDVHAADIDDDGYIDIVGVANIDDDVTWWENDGSPSDGGWTEHVIKGNVDGARGVYAADIDGDHDVDIVASSLTKLTWWANDGTPVDGGWVGTDISAQNMATSLQVVDIDGNGTMDILVGDNDYWDVEWWDNDGSESFTERTLNNNYGAILCVHAADIDQDGWNDIVASSGSGNKVYWWQNQNIGLGPVPPVPELPTLVLVGVGLIALAGYIWARQRTRPIMVR
ncbi:FG-GAP repeat domain-containing protein [Chloroflexota bacterium]